MDQKETQNHNNLPKIFVVCTCPDTLTLWGFILREKGLHVILETALDKALDHWSEQIPDMIVIDAGLEQRDLLPLCGSFRELSTAPILLLLPVHHETVILDAYRAGVDEVVVKPVSPMIFQAKIMAWARRSWTVPIAGLDLVTAGRHRLDPEKHCLIDPHGREIKLTNLEFNLLHLLMSSPDRVFGTDELIRSVWGSYHRGDQSLLKNVVYRLRKKIESDHRKPVFLLTWPTGYSFNE